MVITVSGKLDTNASYKKYMYKIYIKFTKKFTKFLFYTIICILYSPLLNYN